MCKLYADDSKLYSVIQTPDDINILQDSLDALVAWSDEWQLTISKSKSAILSIGQPNIITQAYRIKDTDVSNVQKIRDLGITIDDKLTWSQHVSNILSKARIRANLIFKCFHSRDRYNLAQNVHNICQATTRVHLPGVVAIHGKRNS